MFKQSSKSFFFKQIEDYKNILKMRHVWMKASKVPAGQPGCIPADIKDLFFVFYISKKYFQKNNSMILNFLLILGTIWCCGWTQATRSSGKQLRRQGFKNNKNNNKKTKIFSRQGLLLFLQDHMVARGSGALQGGLQPDERCCVCQGFLFFILCFYIISQNVFWKKKEK